MVDKRPQRAAPQVGAKVVQIASQKGCLSCVARTAPAHDARARLATWPLQGGTQHDTGLEHDLATHTETVPGGGRQSASLEEGRIFVGNE